MKGFLLGLLLLWGSSPAWAQTPVLQWQRQLGGHRRYNNVGWGGVFRTSHNRLVTVNGELKLRPYPNFNYYAGKLTRYANNGDTLTTTNYQATISDRGLIFATGAECRNGDFLAFGTMTGAAGISDYLVVRTDSLGGLRWTRSFGNGRAYDAMRVLPLPDDGALLVYSLNDPIGTPNYPVSRANVLRLDSLGNIVWQRQYGSIYHIFRNAVALPDGSYALLGQRSTLLRNPSRFVNRAWVLRITANGDTLRSWASAPGDNYYPHSVQPGPAGGLLLAGSIATPGDAYADAFVQWLDSADRPGWAQRIRPTRTTPPLVSGHLNVAYPLATPGQAVVAGLYAGPLSAPYDRFVPDNGYLAQYNATPGGGAAPVWERQFISEYIGPTHYAVGPGGTLTVAFNGQLTRAGIGPPDDIVLTRFAGLPLPYVVPYCQQPPGAYFAAAAGPAALQVLDASTAGPRYAQLVAYRWTWGDGTASSGPAPGPHAYATPPPVGTPVTLTVTNNLGCTSTRTEYPFGRPTASQQARALQAGTRLYPNPAAEGSTLAVAGLAPQPPVPVQVLDALGRVVLAAALPVPAAGPATLALDVRGLTSGVYLVRLLPREGPLTCRLVKQ